jgi:hypothetical protein
MRIETLSELLEYREGNLYWRKTRRGKARKGSVAGSKRQDGYVMVEVGGNRFFAHRLIWMLFNGSIPAGMQVDHINGIRDDNRIENLRLLSQTDNIRAASRRPRKNNTSGVPGVYYNISPKARGYVARISVNGKRIELGFRTDFFEAVCLRKSAEVRYGYAKL